MAKQVKKTPGRPKKTAAPKLTTTQKPAAEKIEEKEDSIPSPDNQPAIEEAPPLPPTQEPQEESQNGPDQDVQSPDATDQYQSDVISTIGANLQLAIDALPSEERGKLSDGLHSFDELYNLRAVMFIKMCDIITRSGYPHNIWRSKVHGNGTVCEDYFILGISKHPGKQIIFHLPESDWDDCRFAKTIDRAPEFDGHTSADILERIKSL